MDVKVLDHTDSSLTLRFDDTDPTIVNSIRRTLLADVPKMAIEDVEFHLGPIRGEDGKEYESVAPLFDEIISHRLGLVPIPTYLQLDAPKPTCPTCHAEGKNCRKFSDAYGVKSVKVFNDPTKIRLQFETDGSLSARDTLIAALDILEKRFADLAGKAELL